jgi:hypothetical protein
MEYADKCPLCRKPTHIYSWPGAVKSLVDEYCDFFKNGGNLDVRIIEFLEKLTLDDAQVFQDPHWVRLLYGMHERANALERLTMAFDYECEK